MQNDIWFMNIALEEAYKASFYDEVPVGCLIVSPDGKILSRTHNKKEKDYDATSHAEVLAIREAGQITKSWRLEGCTAYVTLEPCPMCLSALLQSRVSRVVFGAYDTKGGSLSLGYHFQNDKRMNHTFNVIGGVNHFKCSQILSNFFKQKRKIYS